MADKLPGIPEAFMFHNMGHIFISSPESAISVFNRVFEKTMCNAEVGDCFIYKFLYGFFLVFYIQSNKIASIFPCSPGMITNLLRPDITGFLSGKGTFRLLKERD